MKFKKGDKITIKSKHGNTNNVYESIVYRYKTDYSPSRTN